MKEIEIKKLNNGEISVNVKLTKGEFNTASKFLNFVDYLYIDNDDVYILKFNSEKELFTYARLFETFDFTRKIAFAYIRYKLYNIFNIDIDTETLLRLLHRRTLMSIITDLYYMT